MAYPKSKKGAYEEIKHSNKGPITIEMGFETAAVWDAINYLHDALQAIHRGQCMRE